MKLCYGRILPLLAVMASRRVGMPLIPCQLFSHSLVGIKYYTKAEEGVGESWYRHSDAFLIYSTGQGSCALHVVWTLIRAVLINALCVLHKKMTFEMPDGKKDQDSETN